MSTATDVTPPTRAVHAWAIGAALALGVLVGLSVFTIRYAEAFSYLSDNPSACMNCHIMREQFEAWNRSSHRAAATCNSCHTPHSSLAAKWAVKGLNGVKHSFAFTTGLFHEPIRITPFDAAIAQANCIDCHETAVSQIHGAAPGGDRACTSCHGNVGHDSRLF
jgi:cytochrome c nitrite reductase small subunit